MTNFLPHTDVDRQTMLAAIGKSAMDDLFTDIPKSLRAQISYNVLPKVGLSEPALMQELKTLANLNQAKDMASFLGGGAYHRFIPMAVNTIASRSEFYTAYTPYQPEISQGTLQVGYEFQTMIGELTGMDVANASVYDGGVALAEAAFMAVRLTRRKHLLIANTVNPEYRQILDTYVAGLGEVTVETFDPLNVNEVFQRVQAESVAAVLIQQPNYLGFIEEVSALRTFCQNSGALFVVSADPVSLGLMEAPGNYGADIVVGDIQPLGNNLSFGGPYGGFMATKERYMRQLPGRLVGRTEDKAGRPCYTLTLQTREQHIRRAKATSNICTNQALNILKATVYLTVLGPQGLKQVAHTSVQRAHALAERLTRLDGVELVRPEQPFGFEFTVRFPIPVQQVLKTLESVGILGGIPVESDYPQYANSLLIAATEMTTPDDLERYVRTVTALLNNPEQAPPSERSRNVSKNMMGVC